MRTPYKSSDTTRKTIARLHYQEKSLRQMSALLRLDISTIRYHLRKMGLVKKQTAVMPKMVDDPVINTANHWLTRRWV